MPGLRPDKVLRLYKDLGITSLDELKAATKQDRIKKAKGLGAAVQTKILHNLETAKGSAGLLHLHRAAALLEHSKKTLEKTQPELKHVTIAGDLRRSCELVGELALVAETPVSERTDHPGFVGPEGLRGRPQALGRSAPPGHRIGRLFGRAPVSRRHEGHEA
ncbi:hypothetical protein [Bradyrhizobium sp. RDI18]|uniref:hypothetical protein n=1 Tax=Bradyrhizobium sp. RDI18 TaxID=3367400 RepID=UPI00371D9BDD